MSSLKEQANFSQKPVPFIHIIPVWALGSSHALAKLGSAPPGPGPAWRLPLALFVRWAPSSDLPPLSQLTCLCFFPSAKSALLPSFGSGAVLLPALLTAVQVRRKIWTNTKTWPALLTWVLQLKCGAQKFKQQLCCWDLALNPHKSKVIWKQLAAALISAWDGGWRSWELCACLDRESLWSKGFKICIMKTARKFSAAVLLLLVQSYRAQVKAQLQEEWDIAMQRSRGDAEYKDISSTFWPA